MYFLQCVKVPGKYIPGNKSWNQQQTAVLEHFRYSLSNALLPVWDICSHSPQLSAGKNCRLSNWDEKGSVTVHPGNYGVFCIQIDKETAPKLPDVTLGMPCLRRECATFLGEWLIYYFDFIIGKVMFGFIYYFCSKFIILFCFLIKNY